LPESKTHTPVGLQAPECDFRDFSNIVYVLFDFFLSDFNAFSIGETTTCVRINYLTLKRAQLMRLAAGNSHTHSTSVFSVTAALDRGHAGSSGMK
jgi:hypothetical protein